MTVRVKYRLVTVRLSFCSRSVGRVCDVRQRRLQDREIESTNGRSRWSPIAGQEAGKRDQRAREHCEQTSMGSSRDLLWIAISQTAASVRCEGCSGVTMPSTVSQWYGVSP